MLKFNEGRQAVLLARKSITHKLEEHDLATSDLDGVFLEKRGVFVTIHSTPGHLLRGCIGIPYPIITLKDAVIRAGQMVTTDPRFPPLTKNELDTILVEVTILTKPKLILNSTPENILSSIEIGVHGLIVEFGQYSGLLLPQVPVEQGWNKEEFIANTCVKAGLPSDTWLEKDLKLYLFRGQIFSEIKPYGEIVEKTINGSDN
ncbi:MAG: TIGR00296 family protein [Thermoplasmatota archaeon]